VPPPITFARFSKKLMFVWFRHILKPPGSWPRPPRGFVLGVAVPPDDVAADHAGLLLVGAVVSAVEGEVAQGGELGLDAVHPAGVDRNVGELTLDVVVPGQVPTRWSAFVDRCGLKLSSTIAMRTSGG